MCYVRLKFSRSLFLIHVAGHYQHHAAFDCSVNVIWMDCFTKISRTRLHAHAIETETKKNEQNSNVVATVVKNGL